MKGCGFKMQFYDWRKTFSYSKSKWVFVISSRGYGKTYGLRKQCIQDFIKRKRRFVEVVRHKSELKTVGEGYFAKLESNNEFPGCEFKYEGQQFLVKRPGKDAFELMGYLVALTDEQLIKKQTFADVKRFIFDEALIEHKDRYKRYLPREFARLVGIRSSITRETPDNPSDSVVYLLGNAVDFTSPYFEDLGIKKIPDYGRHTYMGGDVLLDYVEPVYFDEYTSKTAIGRVLAGTIEGKTLFANAFAADNLEHVEAKPKGSKFWRGYVFSGHVFALWLTGDSYCYVTSKAPKSATLKAFTLDDDSINYDLIRKSGQDAKTLRTLFYRKFFRYESAQVRERFADMLLSLGIV